MERIEHKLLKKLDDYLYMAPLASKDADHVEPSYFIAAMMEPKKKEEKMASYEEMQSLQNSFIWICLNKNKRKEHNRMQIDF